MTDETIMALAEEVSASSLHAYERMVKFSRLLEEREELAQVAENYFEAAITTMKAHQAVRVLLKESLRAK